MTAPFGADEDDAASGDQASSPALHAMMLETNVASEGDPLKRH
jgi:hypothetical protein